MATKTPPRPSAPTKSNQLPDEKFWVKYSPHHELPLSGMASLAWHTLAVVLIVAVAWVVARNSRDDMPLEVIQLARGGGGGSPGGIGDGPGDGRTSLVEAATRSELPPDARMPEESLKDITG